MIPLLRRSMEHLAADFTAQLTLEGCLVLAPHPDDEVLGCGGTIALKVRNGARVMVAFMTDGRRGLPGPVEHAVRVRENEARNAASRLGVSPENLVFLRFEDGKLQEHIATASGSLQQLIRSMKVKEIFVPYRREYHPDHRATWQIAQSCDHEGIQQFEYPIWYGPWLWKRLGWRARGAAIGHLRDIARCVKVDISPVADIKRRALAAHHSQVLAFENGGKWGTAFIDSFVKNHELFFAGPSSELVARVPWGDASSTRRKSGAQPTGLPIQP